MNKEFRIVNNEVIVTDEKGNKISRALIPNIREVLICENNIDALEDLIENEEEQIKESKKIIRNKGLYYFSLGSLWSVSTTLHLLQGNTILGCVFGLNVLSNGGLGTSYILPEAKNIKIRKEKIDIIKRRIAEERAKIYELNINEGIYTNNIPSGQLEVSDDVRILKRKLSLLQYFRKNTRKILRLYKNDIIKVCYPYYNNEELQLLEEIIQEHLNKKQKVKHR